MRTVTFDFVVNSWLCFVCVCVVVSCSLDVCLRSLFLGRLFQWMGLPESRGLLVCHEDSDSQEHPAVEKKPAAKKRACKKKGPKLLRGARAAAAVAAAAALVMRGAQEGAAAAGAEAAAAGAVVAALVAAAPGPGAGAAPAAPGLPRVWTVQDVLVQLTDLAKSERDLQLQSIVLGCSKCRHLPRGCGRCRRMRAADFLALQIPGP